MMIGNVNTRNSNIKILLNETGEDELLIKINSPSVEVFPNKLSLI